MVPADAYNSCYLVILHSTIYSFEINERSIKQTTEFKSDLAII
jgi:hypothetical protein